jgi:hypothetical protein
MGAPLSICVAFFSPCDYELPKQHLAQTLKWIAAENVEATLAQVVLPGQHPQPVPPGIKSLVYASSDVMFYKENLWNLAARNSASDKLLFVDGDVNILCEDLTQAVTALLDECDVCQPFSSAAWLSRDGAVGYSRPSAAYALVKGFEPITRFYHPGFAWAMTRDAFNRLRGFYDHNATGSGDIAFSYSLDKRWRHINLRAKTPNDAHFSTTPRYNAYRDRGVSLDLRVGYLADVECQHLWHGDMLKRRYTQRATYCPLRHGEDFPVTYRDDGLLMWTKPEISEQMKQYFLSRQEDG